MTRDEFTAGYVQRFRNVIQKHEHVDACRKILRLGSSPIRESLYARAQSTLDVTLVELGDYVYDALESVREPTESGKE